MLFCRWSVSFKQTNKEDSGDPPPLDIINNYFSIGVVCLFFRRVSVLRRVWLNENKAAENFIIDCFYLFLGCVSCAQVSFAERKESWKVQQQVNQQIKKKTIETWNLVDYHSLIILAMSVGKGMKIFHVLVPLYYIQGQINTECCRESIYFQFWWR